MLTVSSNDRVNLKVRPILGSLLYYPVRLLVVHNSRFRQYKMSADCELDSNISGKYGFSDDKTAL